MMINKIIINLPTTELARKTHIKIINSNIFSIHKFRIDIKNNFLYVNCNIDFNNQTLFELGEMKDWINQNFVKNFNIKYKIKNNLMLINENYTG